MSLGLSEKIRALAQAKYVNPALHAGKEQFSIRVRDLLGDLQAQGFAGGHTPQICSALQTAKFLRENGLEIEEVEGPPSKMSPTVVVRYRVVKHGGQDGTTAGRAEAGKPEPVAEDPSARAMRLAGKLRGIMKEELEEFGGGEAFLRWVRSEDEDAA